MNKRILSVLLTVAMVLCMVISAIPTIAEVEQGIAVSDTARKTGETLTVTLKVPAVSELVASVSLGLNFDTSAFTLTDYSMPEVAGAAKSTLDTQKATLITGSNSAGNFGNGYASNDSAASVTWSAIAVTCTFTVNSDAVAGSYDFTVSECTVGGLDDYGCPLDYFTTDDLSETEKTATVEIAGVSLNKDTLSLKAKETETLTATVFPSNLADKTVAWESSDSAVATVENGLVTGVKPGNVTITAKNVNNETATCAVTVTCDHTNTYNVKARASTCTQAGWEAYVLCLDCGTAVSGSNAFLPLAEHNYTKEDTASAHLKTAANCTSPAVYYKSCTVCGANGTETFTSGSKNASNHVGGTEVRNAVTATCIAEGYTGDTYCKGCNTKIQTGSATQKTEHTAAAAWTSDGTSHWHACTTSGCTEKLNLAACSGGTATCTNKAVCAVCKQEYGSKNASNHVGGTEVRNAVTATCIAEGYTGDTYCKGCGTKIQTGSATQKAEHTAAAAWTSDGTSHWHACTTPGCTEKLNLTACSGGTATCTNKAVCTVCKQEYGSKNASNHVGGTEVRNAVTATCLAKGYTGDTYCKGCDTVIEYGAETNKADHTLEWQHDDGEHWQACTTPGCSYTTTNSAHTGGTATCVSKRVCTDCGAEYGAFDADNHVNTEIRDAVPATCTVAGYTGDTWCTDCETKIEEGEVIKATGKHADADDKWESDADNHWHTCSCGKILDSAAHTASDWIVDKEAAVGAEGAKHKACTVCGYVLEKATIPALTETKDAEQKTDNTATTTTTATTATTSPETGESITLWIALAFVAALSLTGSIICGKKRSR